nr:uncharacterized protein LOC117220351 [Megalopta genalis]
MVERFHRQLKAGIMCHEDNKWTQRLPIVLLGIRSAPKEDLQASSTELVYGESVRLPGEFFENHKVQDTNDFVKQLRQHIKEIKPTAPVKHGEKKPFIFKDLATSQQVFVRHDAVRKPLQPPYDGPYTVIDRATKYFTLDIAGKHTKISIDRLKPAYLLKDAANNNTQHNKTNLQPEVQAQGTSNVPTTTRSGRRVKFPDFFGMPLAHEYTY